jgi:F-type H+-transporting ATPase subunit b
VDASMWLDPVFIAKAVSFVLVVGFGAWLFDRLGKPWLAANQEALNHAIAEAEAKRKAAEADLRAAQASVVTVGEDSVRMVDAAQAQAAYIAADERAKAAERAKRMLDHAAGELERERNRVRDELLESTVERSFTRAKEIVVREVDASAQRRLVDRFVTDLEAGRNG